MAECPICRSKASSKYKDTPYWDCPFCGCWFQSPMPPKVYEADHEKDSEGGFTGHLMSDYEKDINKALATNIFSRWFSGPIKTLDIGAKYPYLAYCFKELGCESYAMDNIEIVPEYSKALDVPMLMADFENISEEQIAEWTHTDKFQLITMVHMFEHLYNPLAALKKMKKMLTDDGVLFLRLPQHDVSGFERDLTTGHYTIHPFFHSLTSLLELLVQAKDLFTIEWERPMEGGGQRDLILKPIKKKPEIYVGMIVKNEERDLPKCLNTIRKVADGIVIVDTGSTDNTERVAKANWPSGKNPMIFTTYTEASEKDETGDWKLWNFGKARNHFVDIIENKTSANYLIWMDADDTLVSPPENLRRVVYLNEYTVFGFQIESGDRWVHHRMWKTGNGIHFEGAIHEYPVIGDLPTMILSDTVIHHDPTPATGENSNARNLRILLKDHETAPTSRSVFYLANTYKDASNWLPAVKYYDERIKMGEFYRDEWLFAYLYKARCERASGDTDTSIKTLLEALSKEPSWAEFWMELSYIYMAQGKIAESHAMALVASAKTPPYTALWRESNKYADQPLRMLSFCSEYSGDIVNALAWAKKAKTAIGVLDVEWDNRITMLESQLGSINKRQIALVRPGAIGDVLMTLNCIPELKKLHPECEISYYCHKSIGEKLSPIMKMAGVDNVFDYNVDIIDHAKCDKVVNLIGYPVQAEDYPNNPMKRHLIDYFAAEMGCKESNILPLNLKLPRVVGTPKRYATIHTKAGWSVYKNWAQDRWEEVIKLNPDIEFYQIGAESDPRLLGATQDFMGKDLMTGLALIANATMHVGVDSFSNHATHLFGTPAVILWGSTQWSAAGYSNNLNISLGLSCQPCFREDPAISQHPKDPCINPEGQVYENPCHACMEGISVEMVDNAVKTLWSKSISSKR